MQRPVNRHREPRIRGGGATPWLVRRRERCGLCTCRAAIKAMRPCRRRGTPEIILIRANRRCPCDLERGGVGQGGSTGTDGGSVQLHRGKVSMRAASSFVECEAGSPETHTHPINRNIKRRVEINPIDIINASHGSTEKQLHVCIYCPADGMGACGADNQ